MHCLWFHSLPHVSSACFLLFFTDELFLAIWCLVWLLASYCGHKKCYHHIFLLNNISIYHAQKHITMCMICSWLNCFPWIHVLSYLILMSTLPYPICDIPISGYPLRCCKWWMAKQSGFISHNGGCSLWVYLTYRWVLPCEEIGGCLCWIRVVWGSRCGYVAE